MVKQVNSSQLRATEFKTLPKVGGHVEILCGMHKGDRVLVLGTNESNVIVDVHDKPHLYRLEDVRKLRKNA